MNTCDRCIARAQATVVLPSGSELYFCNHHMTEHLPVLALTEGVTWQWDNETVLAT